MLLRAAPLRDDKLKRVYSHIRRCGTSPNGFIRTSAHLPIKRVHILILALNSKRPVKLRLANTVRKATVSDPGRWDKKEGGGYKKEGGGYKKEGGGYKKVGGVG